jgi:hypothetical protein
LPARRDRRRSCRWRAATGSRYRGITNSMIQTDGGGASFYPGDTAGSTNSDAVYN